MLIPVTLDSRSNFYISPLAMVKWASVLLISLWSSFPSAIQALLVLMCIDWASGFLLALKEHRVSSSVGKDGLIRKSLTLLLITATHWIIHPLGLKIDFASTVAYAFAINEAISIAENCALAGVPIPQSLINLLSGAKNIVGYSTSTGDIRKKLKK